MTQFTIVFGNVVRVLSLNLALLTDYFNREHLVAICSTEDA